LYNNCIVFTKLQKCKICAFSPVVSDLENTFTARPFFCSYHKARHIYRSQTHVATD